MKKLGLLIVGAFLLTACDATPKGNKSILPVEHDVAVEPIDHHESHGSHEGHGHDHEGNTEANHDAHHAAAEKKDSANKSADTQKVEKDVDAKKVDESPENAAH